MKKLVIGMLAHVDAGKTTLSESILYTSGAIRKFGRVDNKDAFLDNNDYERQRGITIFSKQAVFTYKDLDVTLLDTPGHVDFRQRWRERSGCLIMLFLLLTEWMGFRDIQRHFGDF